MEGLVLVASQVFGGKKSGSNSPAGDVKDVSTADDAKATIDAIMRRIS